MFRRKKQKRLLQASGARLEERRDAVEPLYYPAFRKRLLVESTLQTSELAFGKNFIT